MLLYLVLIGEWATVSFGQFVVSMLGLVVIIFGWEATVHLVAQRKRKRELERRYARWVAARDAHKRMLDERRRRDAWRTYQAEVEANHETDEIDLRGRGWEERDGW